MVDVISFKFSSTPALLEAVLDVKESNDHILVHTVPTHFGDHGDPPKVQKVFCSIL